MGIIRKSQCNIEASVDAASIGIKLEEAIIRRDNRATGSVAMTKRIK